MKIIGEPGRYFAAGSMDLVTSIISKRCQNEFYFDDFSPEETIPETIYYLNEGPFQSLANIIYEKCQYSVRRLESDDKSDETLFSSSVYGPTCDSSDCLTKFVHLPQLDIGDRLIIYHVGAYSISCSTNFNGFQTKQIFYIWKDEHTSCFSSNIKRRFSF